jgi:hypothetical protein
VENHVRAAPPPRLNPSDDALLGRLLRVVAERSQGGYMLIRTATDRDRGRGDARAWRVSVRRDGYGDTVDEACVTDRASLSGALARAAREIGSQHPSQRTILGCCEAEDPA